MINRFRFVSLFLTLAALFFLTTSSASAANFLSFGSGAWNAPAVWGTDSVFGTVGSGAGQFEAPSGITVDSNGNIYVSEEDNYRIQKFDPTGNFISAWGWGVADGADQYEICTTNCRAGIPGIGDGQLSGTFDIIATGTVLYVVDLTAGQVQEFDTDGTFVTKWPTGPNGVVTGGTFDPEGIAVDGSGNVYLQGISTNQIKKFDANGNFIEAWGWGVSDGANHLEVCTSNCQFGIAGGGDGELDHPTHVEVHGTDVYVSDYLNHRITVYDTDGDFVGEWGWGVQDGASQYEVCTSGCQAGIDGTGVGQFDIPEGIRSDSNGNVLVADAGNNDVQEFSSTGAFLKEWGAEGSSPGQFNHGPLGLALDSSSNVYVAEVNGSYRIHKFDENGNPLPFQNCSLSNSCVAGTDYPSSLDNVTIASGTTVTIPASGSFSLGSLLVQSGGTLSQGAASTLFVSGMWNNLGSYNPAPAASVVLNGSSQSILGDTTFADLSKSVSFADTLAFDPNATIAVSGSLSLSGAASNLLSITRSNFSLPTWSSELTFTPSNYPAAVTVDQAGNLYVGDCGDNPAIYKYDSSFNLIQTIGLGIISCAYGVAVDGDGNIYVGDFPNMEKFDSTGTEVASWGPDGVGGTKSFTFGTGVVVEDGKVYAADCTNSTSTAAIYVFDTDGDFINSFGTGTLSCPYFINADSQGNVYVPDHDLNEILKYSRSGTLLQTIGDIPGGGNDEGVAIDGNGFIYATHLGGVPGIQVAYPGGNFFTSFGSTGTGHGEFEQNSEPAITFDSEGNLYVVDNASDLRIQKFSFPKPPSTWNISANSSSLSYLAVSSSTAASIFNCLTGCIDEGGNTNWLFSASTTAPAYSGGGGMIVGSGPTAPTTSGLLSVHASIPVAMATSTALEPFPSTPLSNSTLVTLYQQLIGLLEQELVLLRSVQGQETATGTIGYVVMDRRSFT
jgi:hypothetical protein